MSRVLFLTLLLSVYGLPPAWAAFEALGQGSRAKAMGDAFVVQANDASALWYNPAGLANTQGRQALVDYTRLFPDLDIGPDISSWAVNYAQGLAGGHLGLGVAGLGAGFYTENGAILGYGRAVGKRLSFGFGLRLLRWSADGYRDPATGLRDEDHTGTGVGVDAGGQCKLLRWQQGVFTFGFSGQNLNQPDVSEGGGTGIPRRLILGLGYEDQHYGAEIDLEFVGGDRRMRAGGEYKFGGRHDLRLRAGASGIAGDRAAGELDSGLGLRLGRIVLNYAYHYSAEIATSGHQRLSLGYQF